MLKYEQLINKYELYNHVIFHISYHDAEFWDGSKTIDIVITSMIGRIYFELFYLRGNLLLATGPYMSKNLLVFEWGENEEMFKMLCGNIHDENCCIRILTRLKDVALRRVGRKYGLK